MTFKCNQGQIQGAPEGHGRQPIIRKKNLKNVMKIKNFGPKGGGGVKNFTIM